MTLSKLLTTVIAFSSRPIIALLITIQPLTALAARSTPVDSGWILNTKLDYSSNSMMNVAESERQNILNLEFNPSYRFSKVESIFLSQSFYKNLSREYEPESGRSTTSYSNTVLGYSYYWAGMSVTLPTNSEANRSDNFLGATTAMGHFNFGQSQYTLFNYSISGTKNFHEFATNSQGYTNISHKLVQAIELNLKPFNGKQSLQFLLSFYYTQAWTYQVESRSTQKDFFSTIIETQIPTNYGTYYFGFNNEGSALKPNGNDTNISFYDNNSSMFFMGSSWSY